jgi:CrcB protein
MARHAVNVASVRLLGAGSFPFGTLVINVLGSFLMGVVVEYFALRAGLSQHARLFLTTGFLAGFTTFSTFSLEAALLVERGQGWPAAAYIAGSVILSIAGLFAAIILMRQTLG